MSRTLNRQELIALDTMLARTSATMVKCICRTPWPYRTEWNVVDHCRLV